jgi:hypothetical protein
MSETTATPDPIRRPRPTKYPAHLAAMLPAELKTAIVETADAGGESQGDVVRRWLELGRAIDGAELVVSPR